MTEKVTTGLVAGLFAYIVGEINLLTISLFTFMIIDFLSGFLGSWAAAIKVESKERKKNPSLPKKPMFWWVSDEKITLGIIKKFGILILWFISILIQLVVMTQGEKIGIHISTPFVTIAMTFYLLGSEIVSVTRNLSKMGVKSPDWIKTLSTSFRKEKL